MKAICIVILLSGCTPSPSTTPAGYDVTIVTSDASDADPCAVAKAVCAARLIRAPDGGALCPPCD